MKTTCLWRKLNVTRRRRRTPHPFMLERRFLWTTSLTKSSTQRLAVFCKSRVILPLMMTKTDFRDCMYMSILVFPLDYQLSLMLLLREVGRLPLLHLFLAWTQQHKDSKTMKTILIISSRLLGREDVDIKWFVGMQSMFPIICSYHCCCSMPIVLSWQLVDNVNFGFGKSLVVFGFLGLMFESWLSNAYATTSIILQFELQRWH